MWQTYALLSAVFAALTALFIKMGVKNIDANLAMAVRVTIILAIVWAVVFATGAQEGLARLDRSGMLFLALSAVATGLSWLFYFHAMQTGDAARVAALDKLSVPLVMILAFVVLKEPATAKTIAGGVLITAGSLLLIK